MKETCAGVLGILLGGSLLFAHGAKPWPVPEEARKRRNPVAATAESAQQGAKLYREKCLVCHGERGDGQGPWREKLSEDPTDFTDAKMMSRMTDGEIYWKISQGRGQMPAFKDKLNPRQRWHVVNYVRTLAREKPAAGGGERR